jgi:hypothetical protein
LPQDKSLLTANSLDQAYRARREVIEERRALIGPVQALTPGVKRAAEIALRQTADFCQVLGRDVCLETHQVPFIDEELHAFETVARRVGYRGRNLLRYVPENISWDDLSKLPFKSKLPDFASGVPRLPTVAPHGDELGVLNGCWYLHIPRLPFLSANKTMAEQEGLLLEVARSYRARPTLITLCDATDLVFLVALAAWCGDLDREPVSIARTMTGASTGFHACVVFGPSAVEIVRCEDDFRAPYLGIAPALV